MTSHFIYYISVLIQLCDLLSRKKQHEADAAGFNSKFPRYTSYIAVLHVIQNTERIFLWINMHTTIAQKREKM